MFCSYLWLIPEFYCFAWSGKDCFKVGWGNVCGNAVLLHWVLLHSVLRSLKIILSPSFSSKCCFHPAEEHRWDQSYWAAGGQLRNAIHFANESLKGEFIACSPSWSEGKKKKGWINLNNKSEAISVCLSNKQKQLNSLHNFIIPNDSPSSVSLVSSQMTVCRCVFSGIRGTTCKERLLWSCASP